MLFRSDRIMPVNQRWSLFPKGPKAVLPPNGAMVLGLRDVQGYDSLFPGQYKDFMNRLAGQGKDASPLEVGNMVFAKDPYSPLVAKAGVRVIASMEPLTLPGSYEKYVDGIYLYDLMDAPGRAYTAPGSDIQWLEDGPTRVTLRLGADFDATLRLADQRYPGWHATVDGREVSIGRDDIFRRVHVPSGLHTVRFIYRPAAFQVGLYLMLAAASICIAVMMGRLGRIGQMGVGDAISSV